MSEFNQFRLILGAVILGAVALLDVRLALYVLFNYNFGIMLVSGDAFMVSQAIFISAGAILMSLADNGENIND